MRLVIQISLLPSKSERFKGITFIHHVNSSQVEKSITQSNNVVRSLLRGALVYLKIILF